MATDQRFERQSAISRRAFLKSSAAAGAVSAVPAAAWAAEDSGSPRKGGILRVAHTNNPSSLDPTTGRGGSEHTILWGIFDTLIGFEPKTVTAVPGLARAWNYPDPQTLVLDLETGVVFHDGTTFDGAAVKANFDRMLSNPRSTVKADIDSLASVEVVNPARVALHLKYPDSAMPLILSLLEEGESYGYAIIRRVRELSGGGIAWTDGMLYPVLHRLEAQDCISSRWREAENGRKRKYYALKRQGHKALQEQREQWLIVHGSLAKLWGV